MKHGSQKSLGMVALGFLALLVLLNPWSVRLGFADDDDGGAKFYGTVQALPTTPGFVGDWTVSGKTVHVSASTRIEQEHGLVALGAYVEVEGSYRADGSMDAWKIEVKSSGSGGSGSAKFYGVIESLPASGFVGDWTVSGKVVHVSASTRINQEHGLVAVGAYVEVEGSYRADGSMDAWKIEVKSSGSGGSGSMKFYGVIESLPASGYVGDWTVSGKTVHVSAGTRIEQEHGVVALGAYVEVEGIAESDGSLTAFKIEVKSSSSSSGTGSAATRFAVLRLASVAPALAAEGKVVIKQFFVDGALVREDLKVSLEHLLPRTAYDVFVDGIHAGAILTNDEGEGKLFLSSAPLPEAEPLPQELSPLDQRQRVDVKQGQEVVLTGSLASASWGGSGSPQPAQVGTAALISPQGSIVGVAVVKAEASEQELKIFGFSLPPASRVQVLVDGVLLATVDTEASGGLRASFSSRPSGDDLLLPDALLPVTSWTLLELKGTGGELLGSGQFALSAAPQEHSGEGSVRRHLGGGRR